MTAFLPKSIQKLIEELSRLPGVGPKSAQRLAMHLLRTPQVRVQSLAQAIGDLQHGLEFCRVCWNIAENEVCTICADPMRNQKQICVVEDILDVLALERTSEYQGTYHVLHGVLSPVDGIGPEQLKIDALVQRVRVGDDGSNGMGAVKGARAEGEREGFSGEFAGFADGLRDGSFEKDFENHGLAHRPQRTGKMVMPEDEFAAFPKFSKNDNLSGVGIEIILATNPSLEGETTAMYLLRLLKPLGARVTRIARGLPAGGDLDYADELTLSRALNGRAEYI